MKSPLVCHEENPTSSSFWEPESHLSISSFKMSLPLHNCLPGEKIYSSLGPQGSLKPHEADLTLPYIRVIYMDILFLLPAALLDCEIPGNRGWCLFSCYALWCFALNIWRSELNWIAQRKKISLTYAVSKSFFGQIGFSSSILISNLCIVESVLQLIWCGH